MAHHFHAVVWIDHIKARVLHFSADEHAGVDKADEAVLRSEHVSRDVSRGEKRTGHRLADDHAFFDDVARAIADAGAILIVGPGEEKTHFSKYLSEKFPKIKANVEGVEASDHPTDGELLASARRYLKAADRMRT
jgi:hypothetical protein